LLLGLWISSIPVFGQCTTDQVQDIWNGGTSERNLPGNFEWQSFTAGVTGELCQVDLMFCNSNVILDGSGTLNIYSGEGVGGPLLSTQSVQVDGTANTFNQVFWQSWTIAEIVMVNEGSIYTFQFIPTQGGGLPDPYLIQILLPGTYAGGHNYNLGTQGDCTFRTYVNGSTGISQQNADVQDEWQVFPIPADDHLTIAHPGNSRASAQVIDPAGRSVMGFDVQGEQATMDISGLKPGTYLLRLTCSGTAGYRRFVKH
jgi:hypothetical protein